jgi:hypothetical protein
MKDIIKTTIICEKCGYWAGEKKKDRHAISFGECKRYPNYIRRESKDWCGEFRLMEE